MTWVVCSPSIRVEQTILLPLTKAKVFPIFVYVGAIVTIRHTVEHHFPLITVGDEPGTKSGSVGQLAQVGACYRARLTPDWVLASLGVPGPLKEMVIVTQMEGWGL